MVTRSFAQGLSWLHARVGRRIPVTRTCESTRYALNARRKALASVVALRPTVFRPSVVGAD
jgi:hypothetical protein